MKKRQKLDENNDFFTIIEDDKTASNITAPHTLTPEEVLASSDSTPKTYNTHKALDTLKKRMSDAIDSVKEQATISEQIPESEKTLEMANENIADDKQSLLDKCQPYLVEDDGTKTNLNKEPLYKLQSVAEILRSDSEKVLERLSEKYDISFDDLGNSVSLSSVNREEPEPVSEEKVTEMPPETEHITSFEDKLVISDIDTPITKIEKPKNDLIFNTATVTFTPIGSNNERTLNVSSQTRPLNLTGEFMAVQSAEDEDGKDEVKLQESEFEEFEPREEINTEKDGLRLLRNYSIKKRKGFVACAIAVLTTLVLCLNWIPPIKQSILENNTVWMIVFSVLTLITVLFNAECFKSFKKIFSRDGDVDICVSLSVITVSLYTVFGILNKESVTEMLIFLNLILVFRAASNFMKAAYMATNIKIAISHTKKETLKLINDSAITYTLAENSVDGDALVAAVQPADNISDFMKYSTSGTFLDGKLPFITAISLILSVISGIVCAFYFDGICYGFYAAAVIQCLTALPSAFLIDNLPLFSSCRRLSPTGAMILGTTGADFAEMANAAVISADKLFPKGSITLHQMQALSANNLEDTIIRAASLTECLGSTLAPIFKTIAGTGNITTLPDSDTVKYEDRMGISGWVNDRLLFIGNRTLLEAHGIPVPSLEVDRKILRQGYFPVYVATENKACALIIIQYNVEPDIAKELRKLTDSGVDLLVSSCDPNLTEEMICDYFGLYEDSVKVMTAAGRHTHRNVTSKAKTVSVPAVCGRRSNGIAMVLNTAARIKKSNILLTISYIVACVLGAVIFAYSSFTGSGTLLSSATALLYLVITTAISYLLYLIRKP